MRKKLIISIILILLLPLILANENCWQEGCVDLLLAGGNGFTAFGSNLNNFVLNVSNYNQCSITSAKYTPIITDTDDDFSGEIFVVSDNLITAYNSECGVVNSFSVPVEPRAMPVFTNIDADSEQEIILVMNETILMYEVTDVGVTLEKNISYAALTDTNLDYLSCSRVNNTCLGFKEGSDNITVIDLIAETATKVINGTSRLVLPVQAGFTTAHFGISNTRAENSRFINCLMPEDAAQLRCDVYNAAGIIQNTPSFSQTIAAKPATVQYQDAFIATVNGQKRILVSGKMGVSGQPLNYAIAADMSGTVLFTKSMLGTGADNYSNWAVADFDKDGDNDACFLSEGHGSITVFNLSCYDETFTSVTTYNLSHGTIPVTELGIMNFSYGIAIADYNSSESTLGIATVEGIFYPPINNSRGNETRALFLSGFKSHPGRTGNIITFLSDSGSGSPAYLYTDDTFGFVVRNENIPEACGDGICQIFENDFSCCTDCCNNADTEFCAQDSDCPTGYPTCLINRCVVIDGANQTCNFNSDCPFNNPICFNSRCIRGISGELPDSNIDNVTAAQQDIDSAIENTIGQVLGTSALFRFIIGIAIIIGIMVAVAQIIPNATIVGIVGVLMMIVMTVLNMIPAFVLILFILGGAGVLFFQHQISGRAGGGG